MLIDLVLLTFGLSPLARFAGLFFVHQSPETPLMPATPAQIALIRQFGGWLLKKAPACAAAVMIGCFSVWVMAEKTFATSESVDQLGAVFENGIAELSARMDLSDAEGTVRDLQVQVRQKERDIEELEMVLTDMPNGRGEAGAVLRNRVFALRQDLTELRAELAAEQQVMLDARKVYEIKAEE